jgi:transcriptional regulator of arginine metabolism
MKTWRQAQILEVIDREAVSSQEALRRKLSDRGIESTQATLSRDLKELGLVKRAGDGAYTRPGTNGNGPGSGEQLRKAVPALVRGFERVDALMLLRTDPGQAQALAAMIDRSQLSEVAGTVAGDDTVLLVCRGLEQARSLESKLIELVKS